MDTLAHATSYVIVQSVNALLHVDCVADALRNKHHEAAPMQIITRYELTAKSLSHRAWSQCILWDTNLLRCDSYAAMLPFTAAAAAAGAAVSATVAESLVVAPTVSAVVAVASRLSLLFMPLDLSPRFTFQTFGTTVRCRSETQLRRAHMNKALIIMHEFTSVGTVLVMSTRHSVAKLHS
jgi:reverse gyrase